MNSQETSSGGVLRRGTKDSKENPVTLELQSAKVAKIVARVPRSERPQRRLLPNLNIDSDWPDDRFTALVIEGGEVEAKLKDTFQNFCGGLDTLVLLLDATGDQPAAKIFVQTAPMAAPVDFEVLRLDSQKGTLADDRCPTLGREDSQSAALYADQRGMFVIRIFASKERTTCGWLRVTIVEAKLVADRSHVDGQQLTAKLKSPFSYDEAPDPPEAIFVQSGLKDSAVAQLAYDVDLYDDDDDCFGYSQVGLGVLSNLVDYEAYAVYEDGSLLDVIYVDEKSDESKAVKPDVDFPRVAFPILDSGRSPKKVAAYGGEWVTLTSSCHEQRNDKLTTSQDSEELEYVWDQPTLKQSNESVGSVEEETKEKEKKARAHTCTVLATDGPGVPFPLVALDNKQARLSKCYARMQFTNALLVWTDWQGDTDEEPKPGRRAGAGHYRVLATFSWALEGWWSVLYPEKDTTKGAKIVPLQFAPKAPFLTPLCQGPVAARIASKSYFVPRDAISLGLEVRPPGSHQVLANQIRHQDVRAMAEVKDSGSPDPTMELIEIDLGGLPATRNGQVIQAPHACGKLVRDNWSLDDYGYKPDGGSYSPRPAVHVAGKGGEMIILVNLKNMPKGGGKGTLRCLFDGLEICGPLALQDGEQKVTAHLVQVPGALAWHGGECKWVLEGGPDKCVLPPPTLLELFFVFGVAPKLLGDGVPVELLRFLFLRAKVGGIAGEDKLAAVLTDYCLHGHGKLYDAALGDSSFGVSETGGTFALRRYLAAYDAKVNCYDQAAALQCFAGAFGVKLGWFYLDPVGAVKPSRFVGQKEPTNNPYFETGEESICSERMCERKSAKQCVKTGCTSMRTAVLCHAFVGLGDVKKGGLVFDACVEGHLGQPLDVYLGSAIDSTPELYLTTLDYDCGIDHPGTAEDVYGEGEKFEFDEVKETITGVTGVS